MKHFRLTFIVGFFTFMAFCQNIHAFSFFTVVEVKGDVLVSVDGKNWRNIEENEEFDDFQVIKTRDKSYLKIILSDNTLVQVAEDTYFSMSKRKSSSHINIGRGRVRVLSYNQEKVINTPQKTYSLYEGEFLFNVYERHGLFQTAVTPYDGNLFYKKQVVLHEKYEKRPEVTNRSIYTEKEPYKLWFPKMIEDASYDIAIKVPEEKKEVSRGIASLEPIEDSPYEEQQRELSIEKMKGDIFVHDIVFDEAVRVVEQVVFAEVERLVPDAVKEASNQLVWDVASKSVKRWGVYYAKDSEKYQIPLAVKNTFQNQLNNQDLTEFTPEKTAIYENSTAKVAELRTYRMAKSLVETRGYERAWKETQEYINKMLPEVVGPIVKKEAFDKAVPAAKIAVEKIIKKSDLVYTSDVDKLIKHVAYLTAVKFTDISIKKYGRLYSEADAKRVVGELAKSISHDIATYMASKASDKATNLITTLFSRKRARDIASGVAKESNEELYKQTRVQQRRRVFRAHR